MQRGLEGRRVALYVGSLSNDKGAAIQQALEQAGAQVHVLTDDAPAESYHGGVYAALVAVNDAKTGADSKAVQLVREFMASDKPVACLGEAVDLLLQAGGVAGRNIAADNARTAMLEAAGATPVRDSIVVDDALITAQGSVSSQDLARAVVREFSDQLEDRAIDEMSELSFPASDPPASSPSSIGSKAAPDARS